MKFRRGEIAAVQTRSMLRLQADTSQPIMHLIQNLTTKASVYDTSLPMEIYVQRERLLR